MIRLVINRMIKQLAYSIANSENPEIFLYDFSAEILKQFSIKKRKQIKDNKKYLIGFPHVRACLRTKGKRITAADKRL